MGRTGVVQQERVRGRRRVPGNAGALPCAVERSLRAHARVVLAVSGGRDSMALLDAAARRCRSRVVCVAVFDHGTGAAATRSAALAARRAAELGLPVRVERAAAVAATEAGWREARWEFLRRVACEARAVVATAHTRDDAVETIVLRVLRGAGARGLAGLHAESSVVRPLLAESRATVARYAEARGLAWVEDPSNTSRGHARNRVRLDLLPAMERARPGIAAELLRIGRRAAALRRDVDEVLRQQVVVRVEHGALMVAASTLSGYDAPALALLWPALVARLGVALDRRGTERLAQFTIKGRAGARVQLAGGFEAVRQREWLIVGRTQRVERPAAQPLEDGASVAGWRFRRLAPDAAAANPAHTGLFLAALPADAAAEARTWEPGDRMTPVGAAGPRRLKGLLRDAGVDAASRPGWPVVLVGGEIVWVPGVRRSSAATARSGRPVVWFSCERDDC